MHFLILSSFALLLSCSRVRIENTRACTVAGVLSAGADCDNSLNDQRTHLTMSQFLDFLEPSPKRGGAICQSAEDFVKNLTALENACQILGPQCTIDMQINIQLSKEKIKKLLKRR